MQQNVQAGDAFLLHTSNEAVLRGECERGSLLTDSRGHQYIQAIHVPILLRSLVSAPLATTILFGIKVF